MTVWIFQKNLGFSSNPYHHNYFFNAQNQYVAYKEFLFILRTYLFRCCPAVQRAESSALLEYKTSLKSREAKIPEEIHAFTFDCNLKWFLCHSRYCLHTADPGSCITRLDSINCKHSFRAITGNN